MLKIIILLPILLITPIFKQPLKLLTCLLAILLMFSFTSFSTSWATSPYVTSFTILENFNMAMISLTILVSYLMFLMSMKYSTNQMVSKTSSMFSLTVTTLLIIVCIFFITDNLLLLYIMFELSLLPTLILILKWGYQPERLQSSFYFILYTICASLPLLYMILMIYMNNFSFSMTTSYPMTLLNSTFNSYAATFALILAFLVKLPSWGTHLWLPKAHVEAPVSGSMVLAGILLKLGGYGLMKIIYLMPYTNLSMNLFMGLNMWGAAMIGFVCLFQMDMKKLIAYSSVIHMNLMVVGILSKTHIGAVGAMMMMISHGISSPAMFSLAAFNYEKTGSRNLMLMKGLAPSQPIMTLMWFLILSANMAAPPSLNLVSEVMIAMSALKLSFLFAFPLGLITFMSAAYNLTMYSVQQGQPLHLNPSQKHSSVAFLPMIIQSSLCYILVMTIMMMT